DQPLAEGPPQAAVLDGPREADPALLANLPCEVEGEFPQRLVLVELVVECLVGRQLGVEEGLHLLAEGVLLGGEGELHGGGLAPGRTSRQPTVWYLTAPVAHSVEWQRSPSSWRRSTFVRWRRTSTSPTTWRAASAAWCSAAN